MFLYGERNYLQEQSIPEIVKNAIGIYRDYFREIFLCYFLLVFPAYLIGGAIMVVFIAVVPESILLALVLFVYFVFSTIATMAITVMVSDRCLGNAPGIRRTWQRLSLKSVAKLLATTSLFYLMLTAVYLVWILLFVAVFLLPSFWSLLGMLVVTLLVLISLVAVIVMTLFYPTVVVLEKRWGFNALKRSAQLGRGYYFRSFLVFALMFFFVFFVGSYVLPLTISMLLGAAGYLVGYLLSFVIAPLGSIYIVLMYYDLRVRKEAYDADALEADLRK